MEVLYSINAWWYVLIGYLLCVFILLISFRITCVPGYNAFDDKNIVRVGWDPDDKEDLVFVIKCIFIPGWNLICTILMIIAVIVNTSVKFISKKK